MSDISLKMLNETDSDNAPCKLYSKVGASWSVGRQTDWLAGMAFETPGLNGGRGSKTGLGSLRAVRKCATRRPK